MSRPRLDQPFVTGTVDTPVGRVPRVEARLSRGDRLGTVKVRWGIGRMDYRVDPGLYALGSPDADSPVLVTANYKMSFDRLRAPLEGRSAWILVLDTKGINVWCAAGKGTFGTEELVVKVRDYRLKRWLNHRRLIVPQLGAPGVAAHEVRKRTGFKVVYGPIHARDLPAFMDAGYKATPAMRRRTFPIGERLALVPVELVASFKWAAAIVPALFVLGGLFGPGSFWADAARHGLWAGASVLGGIAAGAVLTPVLLPWLPGRAFSVKGAAAGAAVAVMFAAAYPEPLAAWPQWLEILGGVLGILSIAAFLGMNFTGASTYTSLSGVKREMRWALPLQVAGLAAGFGLWFASRFVA